MKHAIMKAVLDAEKMEVQEVTVKLKVDAGSDLTTVIEDLVPWLDSHSQVWEHTGSSCERRNNTTWYWKINQSRRTRLTLNINLRGQQ